MLKKAVKFTALAVAFGVVASVAFQGTNYMYSQKQGTGKVETQANLNLANAVNNTGNTSSGNTGAMDVSAIASSAMPSVVSITNKSVQEMMTLFGQTQAYESESSGTGIIIGQTDTELLIVTNNHVVNGASTLSVGFLDNTAAEAKLKGADSSKDLAVIAVDMKDISEETRDQIKVIQIGKSSDLQVGEQVIAIGNALGYGQSVTTGIVSALNREVRIEDMTNSLIQTDAAINPGNSGGALLNMQGQLIGINSAKYSDTNVEGMGYAIPVDDVLDIMESLMNRTIREEKVSEADKGFLGITGQDVNSEVSKAYGMPLGVYITSVTEGSAAETAGLQKGDIITKFDGTSVTTLAQLQEQLTYYKAGEEVEITVNTVADGQYTERKVEVKLGRNT